MVVRPELNANLLRVETRTSPDSGIPTSPSGKPETTTWTGASGCGCPWTNYRSGCGRRVNNKLLYIHLTAQNTTARRHNRIAANYCETPVTHIIIIIHTYPSLVVNYRVRVRQHFEDKPSQTATVSRVPVKWF